MSLFCSVIPFQAEDLYNVLMGQMSTLVTEAVGLAKKVRAQAKSAVTGEMALMAAARTKSAVYTGEGLLLPLIELLVTRRRPRLLTDDFELFKTARASINDLLESDTARILRGTYPAEVLAPEPLMPHLKRIPILFREGIRAAQRRQDQKARVFRDEAKELLRGLPEYYQRNFHFQGDGYLSDRSAELYEHQVEVLFAGAADAMRRLIIQPLRDKFGYGDGEGLSFLEVGAGTGRATLFVRLAFPKAKITVLDLSSPYLKRAQSQLARFHRHDFIEADATKLPFKEASFDAVYSVFLFHELPRAIRSEVIRESIRVLRPSGFFGFVDSLQIGDVRGFDESLRQFPVQYHEPFYRDYIETPMAELIEGEGLQVVSRGTGFFSKFIAAQKI